MAGIWNITAALKTKEEREAQVPRPLPRLRERALTIPVPQGQSAPRNWQKTADQRQSPLFRLPYEIRSLIWESIMAIELLHMTRAPSQTKSEPPRFLAVKCPVECDGRVQPVIPRTSRYRSIEVIKTLFKKTRDWPRHTLKSTPKSSLAMLLSCRAIYSETVGLLYSQNTFGFHELDTLTWFSTIILPQRLNLIRTMRIQWGNRYQMYRSICNDRNPDNDPAPHDAATWESFWQLVASMAGLRELGVVLIDLEVPQGWNPSILDYHEQLFRPLCAVKQAAVFNVEYMWHGPRVELDMDDAPFRFSFATAADYLSRFRHHCILS